MHIGNILHIVHSEDIYHILHTVCAVDFILLGLSEYELSSDEDALPLEPDGPAHSGNVLDHVQPPKSAHIAAASHILHKKPTLRIIYCFELTCSSMSLAKGL